MSDKYQERRQLFDNLGLLVKSEQIEIFKILRNNEENYTENSNGIFFDVMLIKEKTYNEMNSFMEFCLKTRQEDSIRTQAMMEMAAEFEKKENNIHGTSTDVGMGVGVGVGVGMGAT